MTAQYAFENNRGFRISHNLQIRRLSNRYAEIVRSVLASPEANFTDNLRSRVQTETVAGGEHGVALIATTARKMARETGYRSFYRGLPAGLAGMFPYAAIDLGIFEALKTAISRRNARRRGCHEEDAAPGGFATAAIGGFSGALGASVVYPLNLLRTRLQSQGTALHPRTYTGLWDVTVQTVQGEGFRGLFKGLTPNLMKVVPAMSIVSSFSIAVNRLAARTGWLFVCDHLWLLTVC